MSTLLRKIMAWGSMGFAFAVLAFFTLPHYRQGESSVAGKTAENFAMDLDGKPAHLSDLRNKVVVLNFWASWCGPCVEETPSLIALQQRIASRNGVVLGVSVDEDPGAYHKFIRDQHLNYPTYLDPSKKIATDYGTSMWPETYIIDRKGVIVRKIIGPQDWNSPELLAYFDAILGQT
ncbi:MAG TPA: TlpA disulfide reductase family protein [Candidatus Acidoferrales bacterium]|jgi:cytochrome c biogenesis protein CcmG/thiol:disulfide interchange protein DsbE|nr:TlpA disulfide reductase family protein [Candidatus Acidoferrales bacterium]